MKSVDVHLLLLEVLGVTSSVLEEWKYEWNRMTQQALTEMITQRLEVNSGWAQASLSE